MARVHTLQSSKKPHTCENCKRDIPRGEGYRYFQVGFRSSYKHIRCLRPECFPKPSQLTNSKVSTILAAQEGAHEELTALTGSVGELDDIRSIVEEVQTAIEEVKDEYQEGLDNWPSGNSALEEKVETLESAYDEIGNFDFDDSDKPACDEHGEDMIGEADNQYATLEDLQEARAGCEACEATADIWWSDRIQEARDAIDAVELP